MESLGWAVLQEIPGCEIVVGAVTRPWEPDVTFRAVPAGDFAAFAEPDYVKIAWTLRADPDGATSSTFRTETRALATDAAARSKFRRYWALLSPGIALIRRLSLRPLKAEAERRAREALSGFTCTIGGILHPSPASPLANRDWAKQAEAGLRRLGVVVEASNRRT